MNFVRHTIKSPVQHAYLIVILIQCYLLQVTTANPLYCRR